MKILIKTSRVGVIFYKRLKFTTLFVYSLFFEAKVEIHNKWTRNIDGQLLKTDLFLRFTIKDRTERNKPKSEV